MKRLLAALLVLLAACAAPAPTPVRQVALATQAVTACPQVGTTAAGNPLLECITSYLTDTPTPTATATATNTPTPTATATALPPSATPTMTNVVQLVGWHAPGTHLDPISHLPLPIHEHGDAPPAWTARASCVPFSQTREGHVFYKGMTASDKGGKGVQSYLITHIASTVAARAHGDHDYMAFFLTPGSGVVSCVQGLLDFGSPPPQITATVDPGIRPIILSKNDGNAPFAQCETWYSAPGRLVFDLGWTICNRWTNFAGVVLGGNGAHRGADWHVYVDRFSEWPGMDPGLAAYAVDDGFGHLRLDFVRNDVTYPADGVPGPN